MSSGTAVSPVVEVQQYLQVWAESLTEALEPAAEYSLHWQAPADTPVPCSEDLLISVSCAGDLSGELSFRLDPPSARQLAQAQELTDEARNAILDRFRKIASLVSARLQPRKADFQVSFGSGLPSSAVTCWLRAALSTPSIFEVQLSDALAACLQPIQKRDPVPASANLEKLGMLMDVELEATLRFGGRRMLLKDILDLCAGSVVELNQQVQEPVELLLDGKLIARGEVVVVDGNYGLRVTEVVAAPGM
jgi:flagellar motor switch protein FliN/FliY